MPDSPAAFEPNQQCITCRPVKTQLAGFGHIFSRRFHGSDIERMELLLNERLN